MKRFSRIPPIRVSPDYNDEANGVSNYVGITMYQGDAAVLAQEVREFGMKWRWAYGPGLLALVGSFVGSGVYVNPYALIGLPLWILSMVAFNIPAINRWLEFNGHEAEVQASRILYGQGEEVARLRESGMRSSPAYHGIFDRMTHDQVMAGMRANRTSAARFVNRHRALLERFKQEYR